MKIEVQIDKKKDIAQQVGEAVAEAMAQDEANADTTPIATPIATDGYSRQQLKELAQTDEYQKFHTEVCAKANELIELISANKPRYNCSIVMGITFAQGKENNYGQAGVCGRGDSVHEAIDRLLDHKGISGMIITSALSHLGESEKEK